MSAARAMTRKILRPLLIEGLPLSVVASILVSAIVYQRGYFSWSWDAINHHVYLGYIAQHSRWHLDVTAAASQTYQYPYLYWPVYQLSLISGDGALVAALWAFMLTLLLTLPLWLISWNVIQTPEDRPQAVIHTALRALATLLGLLSVPVLASVSTTANDALAAVPILWSIALGLATQDRYQVPAAFLLGVGLAVKLSNIVYLPWLLIMAWSSRGTMAVMTRVLRYGICCAIGFALAYWPWAMQLYQATGNPFHPYMGFLFPP